MEHTEVYELTGETGLTLRVAALGAEMQSIRLDETEYLWQGDPEFWNQHAPVLFPFVGRFTEGKYRIGSEEYPMGIHGFAAASHFTLGRLAEDSVTLILADNETTRRQYPYQFLLEITYTVCRNRICISYFVKNLSNCMMYFGIGGHPGFNVPLEKGLSFEDYYLEFGDTCSPDRVVHTDACFLARREESYQLRNGRLIDLHHDLFDEDAVVLQNMANEVTLKSDKSDRSVTLRYPGLPYLGIWHRPHTDAPYVAIEPWTSLPSRQDVVEDFRFKHDLVRLEKGKVWETEWTISVT